MLFEPSCDCANKRPLVEDAGVPVWWVEAGGRIVEATGDASVAFRVYLSKSSAMS
jgi:hypothetical protein